MNVNSTTETPGNPVLDAVVEPTSPLKEWLVEYVGNEHDPENGDVTVEMMVETIAKEFPEFLMVVAEENWIRGYHQALDDVEKAQADYEEKVAAAAEEEDGSDT